MAGLVTRPAAVETFLRGLTGAAGRLSDHDLGVVSADDILDGRGPGFAPSVGDADWRAAQLVARGESGHRRTVEHRAPHPRVELAGRPPLGRRRVRVWVQGGCGRGGRIRRRGAQVVAEQCPVPVVLQGLIEARHDFRLQCGIGVHAAVEVGADQDQAAGAAFAVGGGDAGLGAADLACEGIALAALGFLERFFLRLEFLLQGLFPVP